MLVMTTTTMAVITISMLTTTTQRRSILAALLICAAAFAATEVALAEKQGEKAPSSPVVYAWRSATWHGDRVGRRGLAMRDLHTTINTRYARYSPGQAIEVDLHLRNGRSENWDAHGPDWLRVLLISVHPAPNLAGPSEEGLMPRKMLLLAGEDAPEPRIIVRSGESAEVRLNLSRYFRVDKPGRYKIYISLPTPGSREFAFRGQDFWYGFIPRGSVSDSDLNGIFAHEFNAECTFEITDTPSEDFEKDFQAARTLVESQKQQPESAAAVPAAPRPDNDNAATNAGPLPAEAKEAQKRLSDAIALVLCSSTHEAREAQMRFLADEKALRLTKMQASFLISDILYHGTVQEQQEMARAVTGRADNSPGATGHDYSHALLTAINKITPANVDPAVAAILRPWYEKLCATPDGPPVRVTAWHVAAP